MIAKKTLFILLLLCLGFFLTNSAGTGFLKVAAQPPALPEPRMGNPVSNWFVISPLGASDEADELHGDVAYNLEDQEYLVVWDQFDSGGHHLVYGQRVSKEGTLIGNRFLISPPGVTSLMPSVAYNPSTNGYLVVYEGEAGSKIYAYRLDNHGSPLPPEFQVAGEATYTFREPDVAFETDTQKYLVTWRKDQGAAFSGIEARSLDVTGSIPSSVLQITGMLANVAPGYPKVACVRTNDSCLVTWHKWFDSSLTDRDVNGQIIHMEGDVHTEGPIRIIFGSTYDEGQATVASLALRTGIGQYLVTAQRKVSGVWLIYGQRLSDTGDLYVGDPFNISPTSPEAKQAGVAGKESAQEYLVAWMSNSDIIARTVTTDAGLGEIRSALPAGIDANWPHIATGPYHDFLVITQDRTTSWNTLDIFGYLWGLRVYLPAVQKNP